MRRDADVPDPVACRTGEPTQPVTGAALLAAAYLSRVAEPASVPLWLFVQQHGYLAAAAAVRAGDVPAEVAACTEARRAVADPHVDLAAAERNGIRLLTPVDQDWPHFAFAALGRRGRAAGRTVAGRAADPAAAG